MKSPPRPPGADSRPATVDRLLGRGSLAPLLQRTAELRHATDLLRARLGTPLGDHCQVANWRDDTLVVQVDSAAWASRLRFLAPKILAALSETQGCIGLRKLKVIVRPLHHEPGNTRPRHFRLSARSALLLRDIGESTADAALRETLLRLSRRGS
jgi:hypothetical protein